MFEWISLLHHHPCGAAAGRVAVTAAVEAAAKAAVVMVKMAAAVMRSKSHWLPANVIQCCRWRLRRRQVGNGRSDDDGEGGGGSGGAGCGRSEPPEWPGKAGGMHYRRKLRHAPLESGVQRCVDENFGTPPSPCKVNFGTPPWVLLPTAPPKQPSSGRMLEMWVCALPCARATWVKSLL